MNNPKTTIATEEVGGFSFSIKHVLDLLPGLAREYENFEVTIAMPKEHDEPVVLKLTKDQVYCIQIVADKILGRQDDKDAEALLGRIVADRIQKDSHKSGGF